MEPEIFCQIEIQKRAFQASYPSDVWNAPKFAEIVNKLEYPK